MSHERADAHTVRAAYPLAVEFVLVVAALLGLALWREIVRAVGSVLPDAIPATDDLLVSGLVLGTLFVAGLAAFAVPYARRREIDVGPVLPSQDDLPLVGLAVGLPAVLVGSTKLVGVLTDVPYNSLTMTSYGADASPSLVLLMSGVGLLVAVPTLVLVCQVVIQGSFERVVEADVAALLTTAVAGFVMTSNTGGLATVPDQGRLLAAALFVLVLGVALVSRERVEREWLRYLGYAPAMAFVTVTVLAGLAEISTLAGGLFAATNVLAFGVAAFAYERSGALLVPALAYLSLLLASDLVVFLFEAGMQSW